MRRVVVLVAGGFYVGICSVVVVVVVVVVGGAVVVVVVVGATVVVAAVVVVVVPEALAVWAYAAWMPPTPKVVTTGTANPTAAIFFKNARRSSPVDSVSCWSLMNPVLLWVVTTGPSTLGQ
jgi:hypothetical protein